MLSLVPAIVTTFDCRHAFWSRNQMRSPSLRVALAQHVSIALPEVLSLLLKIMFLLDN